MEPQSTTDTTAVNPQVIVTAPLSPSDVTKPTGPQVSCLKEFLEKLHLIDVGQSNDNILCEIQSLLGPDVKIRYDGKKMSETTIGNTAQKSRFANTDHFDLKRIILTAGKKADYQKEIIRQCNGVVIEFGTWKVLSLPSCGFNPVTKSTSIDISNYDVYDINDGTTVTLYWYEESAHWCLSSANGFEMNDMKWIGPVPYFDAFMTAAATFPKFSLENLSKEKSYTIGFRHNDFHPLYDTKTPKMWLIKITDLVTLADDSTTDIGIPRQLPIVLPDGSSQSVLKWIKDKNDNAFTKYKSNHSDIHYGFILRVKSSTRSNSGNDGVNISSTSNVITGDYVMESELLKLIRMLMYNMPKNQYDKYLKITAENRAKYAALKAYLGMGTKSNFSLLFPYQSKHFTEFDKIFKQISDRIISNLRSGNKPKIDHTLATSQTREENINKIVDVFVNHLRGENRLNVMDKDSPSIISDFIRHIKYTDWYFTCLVIIPEQTELAEKSVLVQSTES